MSRVAIDYLKHIRDECRFITTVVDSEKPSFEFSEDDLLKRAVVRSLVIISEAAKKLSDSEKGKWPQVDWKRLTGMWYNLVHDYMGTDYDKVWEVAVYKIPQLHSQISAIISQAGKK